MSPVIIPAAFSLPETLDCGQAFRWAPAKDSPDTWQGAAQGRALLIKNENGALSLSCIQEEFDAVWFDYFDLGTDYRALLAKLSAMSPVLKRAAAFAPGLRLLRQEPWEALCSFIISQNNHIPRIKGVIARLCEGWGEPIPGSGLRAFPSPQALAKETPEGLAPLRAGYRARYLLDAARKVAGGQVDLEKIAREDVDFGRWALQKIDGVGPKVAECALLYGFHRTQCFPLDVWMNRAMAVLLPGFSPADFGEAAGLAQQLLFHYSRLHPEEVLG